MPLTNEQRLALRQWLYPAVDDLVFGTVERALERHLRRGAVVLDAGAGAGTWVLDRFADRVRLLVGADVGIAEQRGLAVPVLADLAALPFADLSFDLILCYNVIEHLADPGCVFAQFARLLVPGGALVFKTPNTRAPITSVSRLLPVSLRRWMKGGLGVSAADVFPTYYRCNTPTALDRALQGVGLAREMLVTVDQTYDYLYFSRVTYALGLLYSRMLALPALAWLRNAILGVYLKP